MTFHLLAALDRIKELEAERDQLRRRLEGGIQPESPTD
jgi:hypothetical protein